MLYPFYQAQADFLEPLRAWASMTATALGDERFAAVYDDYVARARAALDVFAFARLTHARPSFGIDSVLIDGEQVAVREVPVLVQPFGTLLRFVKQTAGDAAQAMPQPRVLIVAPMSGHFATLLRDTVRTMLQDHDVYITDWHNARDVPLADGRFGLDEYIAYLMDFLRAMGEGAHLLAVCQPCVAALAATALMAEDGDAATPRSMTLMAGPIDTRISPTEVNRLAKERPIEWFERNLISHVPSRYPGAFRRVYPGFVQLTAFMSMNPQRHWKAMLDMVEDLATGETVRAEATRTFYDEYFAVADLPAEFYLETVSTVFQEHALPLGELSWRGRPIRPQAIRRTALLTIEGEKDDICAVGQTLAAQDLCSSIRPFMRTHYVQVGAGHYGVFSGRRWNTQVYPLVRRVIHDSE